MAIGKRISVRNMESSAGNPVSNQFIIMFDNYESFQSYETIIGVKNHSTGRIVLDDSAWDYSRTTSKYRNMWLGLDSKAVKEKIASGEITFADLN